MGAVEIMAVPAEATAEEVAPTDESTLSDTDAIPEAASASEAVEIKTVNPIESGTCVEDASKLCGESKEIVEELKTDEESSTAESIECLSADSDMGSMESLEHLTEPEATKLKQSLDESFSDTEIVIPTVEDNVKKETIEDVIILAKES